MIRTHFAMLIVLALALLLGGTRAAHAAESYDNCAGYITSLPAVITTQGTWCLKKDLSTALNWGNAITINNDDVTIDCNNFKLGGLNAGPGTQEVGIGASGRVGLTVRHCTIRGFYIGVNLAASGNQIGGHTIEDNRFDSNTSQAISVEGDDSVIQRNIVANTGGSTIFGYAIGISATHTVDILDNTVSGVRATGGTGGFVYGIYSSVHGGSISGNRVQGLLSDGNGAAFGIVNSGNGGLTMRNNDVVGSASAGSFGLFCDNSSGHARSNVVNGFATGIETCTDDGSNVIAP
jgi:hypothetical protein